MYVPVIMAACSPATAAVKLRYISWVCNARAAPQAVEVTRLYRQAAMAGVEDVVSATLIKLKEEGLQKQPAQ